MLVVANIFKDEIANRINDANEDEFGVVVENDLEVQKRNYTLDPSLMSKIKYFEASFDGVSYERLVEYDLNALGIATSEEAITEFMADKAPGYFLFGSELYILSADAIADIDAGLRMWIIAFPADIASMGSTTDMAVNPSSTEVGFPRSFHELLARRIIIEYKNSREKPIPLTEKEQHYDLDLQTTLNTMSNKNLDRTIEATVPEDNGQDY